MAIFISTDLNEYHDKVVIKFKIELSEFQAKGSGWKLYSINRLN